MFQYVLRRFGDENSVFGLNIVDVIQLVRHNCSIWIDIGQHHPFVL